MDNLSTAATMAGVTGIVVRQALGTDSPLFTSTPDLIVAGTSMAPDPGAFVRPYAYDWNISAPAVLRTPPVANYLYVRGRNYTEGGQRARVYLYYARSDQLLDPAQWQSSDFWLDSVPQNHLPLSAASHGEYVVTDSPLQWKPPTPETGIWYYLISWTDNSAEPAPPRWPATPFENMGALREYVGEHPAMAILDTQTPGIVVRQTLDKLSPVVTNSPDLIVTGTSAPFDLDGLGKRETYDWYFSQPPVPGAANYLYFRALNHSRGRQQARVYLYYARGDQLLDPAQWRSSGFTVGDVPQNYLSMTAISPAQYLVSNPPAMWTPPPQAQGQAASYVLIAWVDNCVDDSAEPAPPQWPTTPFPSMDALSGYVRGRPGMVILDTVYRGAFLRQFPGQAVNDAGTGAQTSPDLIVSGALAVKDAAQFTTQRSYQPGTLSAQVVPGVRNFIYLRALNTATWPASARVYLYWGSKSNISPPSWQRTNFTYAGQPRNWVDLKAAQPGEVVVSEIPLVWSAPSSMSGEPFLVAYVDDSSTPRAPDFSPFGYLNKDAVAKFVASQQRLSWLALTGQAPPRRPTMTSQTPLAVAIGNNSLYVGVQLSGVPVGGTVSLSVPGPDAANTIVASSVPVPDPDAFIAWAVTWPDGFETSGVLGYTDRSGAGDGQRDTAPADGESLVVKAVPRPITGSPTTVAPTTGSPTTGRIARPRQGD